MVEKARMIRRATNKQMSDLRNKKYFLILSTIKAWILKVILMKYYFIHVKKKQFEINSKGLTSVSRVERTMNV